MYLAGIVLHINVNHWSCVRCHHCALEFGIAPASLNRPLHLRLIHVAASDWSEILCTHNCHLFILLLAGE